MKTAKMARQMIADSIIKISKEERSSMIDEGFVKGAETENDILFNAFEDLEQWMNRYVEEA